MVEELLKFGTFTILPAIALVLGATYSLREIYHIGEKRIFVIVLILGFMLFHQIGEVEHFLGVGEFRDPVVGEVPETAANLIAAGSVYYVLSFTRNERALREELARSRAEMETVKDRMRLIFQNVNDGILLVDLDSEEIIEANRTAHRLLRYGPGELEGLSPYDLHPHEPEKFRELTNALRPDGGVTSENLSCRRSDGSTMPAAVSASRTDLDGRDLLLVTIRDNSDREQYRTQVDLLGRVLRHNLRNDMNVVLGSLGAIENQCKDPAVDDFVDRSRRKCRELIELGNETRKLNNILDTEYRQIETVTDLVPIVDRVVDEYGSDYPQARIMTDFPETAAVQASENVTWAIENVVENAIVHAENDPELRVTIRNERIEEDGQESEWTTVTVADHGPGIPENEVGVLRDDSNRTSTEHGSGLGLWIVQQIARAFDGKLDIDRSPDSGFTTEVSLRLQPARDGYATGSNGG
jgi:PAS domain S-box-containing protein